MKQEGLKKNLVLSTAYQVLSMILPLVTAPYAARVLGAEGIGIYSYTHSYSMYFSIFAALGTASYGAREIARHRNDRVKRSQLFWDILFVTFASSALCLLIWGIWILINNEYRLYYIILTASILGTMFDISWFYAGLEKFQYTVSQNTLFKILGAICIFAFVKSSEDLWIYILILSLTVLFANLSMWIYLPKFVDRKRIRPKEIKHHFKETIIYFIPTIASSIYTVLDKTFIGIMTHDMSESGYYEQATKIVNMGKTLTFAGVNIVLHSRISFLFMEKKYDEIKHKILESMNYILFIGCGLCFGIMGISNRFVPFFFGEGYGKTIQLLFFLCPLIVIVGISNCLGSQYYNPVGKRALSAKFLVYGSIINLLLNIILIPRFRSLGAAIATIIAEIVIDCFYVHFCDNYIGIRVLIGQLWKKIVAGMLMMFTVYMTGTIVENDYVTTAIQIGLGIISYMLLLWIMKDSFIQDLLLPQLKKLIQKKTNR